MFFKLIFYALLIYVSLKVIRFVRAIYSASIVKKREQEPGKRSYSEKDIIDVDFKEIKDDHKTVGNDQQ
ncbi:MAG: hypothetical protein COZ80_02955 [Ignavibacteria bacterium CG_4_8_14_3_um_filter_37_9]|nr:hypothetical protein [Ignavibacteria bacterium]OIO23852.1 MAG: hypothetical protein AUJ54_00735 [Ignavibacteria bacterium CG1_02_37_35]PIS45619.1 MAG: hypothetical protein COT22_04275 [Ignavibacteria bacterium CG08_land_8_20_14_0_20_37_9]PIW99914.1 MAG: hypothetical protein COZ80_02955 [Ignavibacteria bacterium CG_4_8_14_3_um_filter_37_9]PIX93507.1 MAG: hypothetical protein COZ25_10290 [Ignavibacteria bacterium CG_4_10_14_3_um_filter_37_18]